MNTELIEAGEQGAGGLQEHLKDFYGRRLKTNRDFAQAACCTTDSQRDHGSILELLPRAVSEGYAGCGSPVPDDRAGFAGLRVLDLGCGRGADVFTLAWYVGPSGFVHGLDMTEEQLAIAREAEPVVMQRFGYAGSNVAFHRGFIETAEMIPDGSVDLVVSNCVINLSPQKERVFRTIHRVLKEGGEWYVADVVADRRPSSAVRDNPDLVAECLGGAPYDRDLKEAVARAGFPYVWEVKRRVIPTPDLERKLGDPTRFFSVVWRGIKLDRSESVDGLTVPALESRCEDYGQVATYRGNLPTSPARFVLDHEHVFETGRPERVCRNTANILRYGRLSRYFDVTRPVRHFGAFACGLTGGTAAAGTGTAPSCDPASGCC